MAIGSLRINRRRAVVVAKNVGVVLIERGDDAQLGETGDVVLHPGAVLWVVAAHVRVIRELLTDPDYVALSIDPAGGLELTKRCADILRRPSDDASPTTRSPRRTPSMWWPSATRFECRKRT